MTSKLNNSLFDKSMMKVAIEQAYLALEVGEVPVGAVLVYDQKIISKSYNKTIVNVDSTSHAEINVIREAERLTNNYRLNNCSLYVTLEPCIMCLGAIINSRISRVVFGAYDSKLFHKVDYSFLKQERKLNHQIELVGGVMETVCSNILKDFFQIRRN